MASEKLSVVRGVLSTCRAPGGSLAYEVSYLEMRHPSPSGVWSDFHFDIRNLILGHSESFLTYGEGVKMEIRWQFLHLQMICPFTN